MTRKRRRRRGPRKYRPSIKLVLTSEEIESGFQAVLRQLSSRRYDEIFDAALRSDTENQLKGCDALDCDDGASRQI